MTQRFRENGGSFYDLVGGETLVVCPQCSERAVHRQLNEPTDQPPDYFTRRRLTCGGCHFSKIWQGRQFAMDTREGSDGYFGLPLWLTTPCCGNVLWALSAAHLDFLEGYVSAGLREPDASPLGFRNKLLSSRLPKWMKRAKNRDKVLKGLKKLRERLTA